MAETTDKILNHIDHEREQLGRNIDQLESYVREKTDVRGYFVRKPWAFVGGAAVAGLLLAMMAGGDSGDRRSCS